MEAGQAGAGQKEAPSTLKTTATLAFFFSFSFSLKKKEKKSSDFQLNNIYMYGHLSHTIFML